MSLDAFRGVTIAGMILVNNAGSWDHAYAPLRHAAWDGWTPTDLVFPFFLFIVGVSMALSFARRTAESKASLYWKIFRRSLIIFGLGLFLNACPTFDLAALRIPGVLQRIAVVYLCAALIMIHTRPRTQAWLGGLFLLSYWALLRFTPVPNFGAGRLTPEGNLGAYLDNLLMAGHLYRTSWDPEGVLSTIPAISTALAGVLTGQLIRSRLDRAQIAAWIFVLGWAGMLAGWIWGIWFPINKNLWTSSYVLFSAGAALQFLGVCYWLIDCQGWRRWAYPALVFGMNAIAVYVMAGIAADLLWAVKVTLRGSGVNLKVWIYEVCFASWASPLNASLAYSAAWVLLWWFVMWVFYRRGVFIKV
jgi:predicted acyltransferase